MRTYTEGENLYNLIRTAVPDFVESEYPLFIEFVTAFLKFLEQRRVVDETTLAPEYDPTLTVRKQTTVTHGGPAYEARKLLDYRDISTSLDEFTNHFLAMFGKEFPQYSHVPADMLIHSLRKFYQVKGTKDSIEWFFRTIFNKSATVYFPREDILRASDGDWHAPLKLKVTVPLPAANGFVADNATVSTLYTGQRIRTSTGSAVVEDVVANSVGSGQQSIVFNELTLAQDSIVGTFLPNQEVNNIDSEEQVITKILPVIEAAIVGAAGSDYYLGDLVQFSEGPTGGGGYGASGRVAVVANTTLSGVDVLVPGDGFVPGIPVTFTSSTGTGASGVVNHVVYGELLDEDGSGYLILENGTADRIVLEDKNTITLGLTIEPFVAEGETVTLDSTDYGADTGVAQFNGAVLDSSIEIALLAFAEAPFMHPWVFTNAEHTTAALANASVVLTLTGSNTYFANSANVFAITSLTDASTTAANAAASATIIVADPTFGTGRELLYLSDMVGTFAVGTVLKVDGTGDLQVGTVTTVAGSSDVRGVDTLFTSNLRANTHLRLGDGTHIVVRNVVNNTFLQTQTAVPVSANANTFSVVPVGTVDTYTPQAQHAYGKIKSITLTTAGRGYQSVPSATVKSESAQVQELFYLTSLSGGTIAPANGQIQVYEPATLKVVMATGQVMKISITNPGVGYVNANDVIVTIRHDDDDVGEERPGLPATASVLLGALTQEPGQFTSNNGFLSSTKFLQDKDYYNDYTYVVRTSEALARYESILLRLLHPAGFKMLGEQV
jgi:hypothetical protein